VRGKGENLNEKRESTYEERKKRQQSPTNRASEARGGGRCNPGKTKLKKGNCRRVVVEVPIGVSTPGISRPKKTTNKRKTRRRKRREEGEWKSLQKQKILL